MVFQEAEGTIFAGAIGGPQAQSVSNGANFANGPPDCGFEVHLSQLHFTQAVV